MSIRWSYALNQWNDAHDHFVLLREHEVAFKTVSVCGFQAVEVATGSGRWEPLGRKEWIERFYGSVQGLRDALRSCGLSGFSSYFFDPSRPVLEEGAFGWSILNPEHHEPILENLRQYGEILPELGGDLLVARALPAWSPGQPAVDEAAELAARGWNAIGAMLADRGLRLALNIDCLSMLRSVDDVARLLDSCDPEIVGLSIDTADAVIAGMDPAAIYRRFAQRVWHVQLKNARYVDETEDYKLPHPEQSMMLGGGRREIERWYWELDDPRGLVDIKGFYKALLKGEYDGWVVVESDQSPVPATSTMINAWYVQRELLPMT